MEHQLQKVKEIDVDEVKEEFETMGFSNFTLKETAMSKIGWGEKENCVAKILINNQTQFDKNSWFQSDAEITNFYFVKLK